MSTILRTPETDPRGRESTATTTVSNKGSENDLYLALQQKFGCSLCHEVYINAYVTNCQHKFCRRCILKWLRYCKKCPECSSFVSKISPLKRLDSEIERAFSILPVQNRKQRDELKKKRFRAELEWKRLKTAQDTLSSSHLDKMKAAEGLRQRMKDNRKPSRRFRPESDGGSGTKGATTTTFPRISSKGFKKKPGPTMTDTKKLEFIKFPPISNTDNQDSTQLSLASLEGPSSTHTTIIDNKAIGRLSLSDRQLYAAYTRFKTMMKLSRGGSNDRSPASAPEMKVASSSEEPDRITSVGADKEKEQEEITKRLRSADVDEVEEFLRNCPIEKLWEHDLSSIVHGDVKSIPNTGDTQHDAQTKSEKMLQRKDGSSTDMGPSAESRKRRKLLQQLAKYNQPARPNTAVYPIKTGGMFRQKPAAVGPIKVVKPNDAIKPKPTGLRSSDATKVRKKTKRKSVAKISGSKTRINNPVAAANETQAEVTDALPADGIANQRQEKEQEPGRASRKASKLNLELENKVPKSIRKNQVTNHEKILQSRKPADGATEDVNVIDSLEELLKKFKTRGKDRITKHPKALKSSKHDSSKARKSLPGVDLHESDGKDGKIKPEDVALMKELSQAFFNGENLPKKVTRQKEATPPPIPPPQTAPNPTKRERNTAPKVKGNFHAEVILDSRRDPSTFRRSLFPKSSKDKGKSLLHGVLNRTPIPTLPTTANQSTCQTPTGSGVQPGTPQPETRGSATKTKVKDGDILKPKGYDSTLKLYLRTTDNIFPTPSPIISEVVPPARKKRSDQFQVSVKHRVKTAQEGRRAVAVSGEKKRKKITARLTTGLSDREISDHDGISVRGRRSRVRTTVTPTVEMKLFGSKAILNNEGNDAIERIYKIPEYPVGLVQARDSSPSPTWSKLGMQRGERHHRYRYTRDNDSLRIANSNVSAVKN